MAEKLWNKYISGTAWTTLSTVVTSIVQILRLSILSRFLPVADFGVVAILTLVLGLTNTFADLGFSAAIMHKEGLNRNEFSSLYWIQFTIYGIIYILTLSISPYVANFYNEELLSSLIPIIMLELLFYGIGKLYDTLLQKELQFRIMAIRNIVSALCSIIVAIVLAYSGAGIYSLVISTVFHALMLNVWNVITGQKYIKIKLAYDVKSNINLIKIGIYQTGTQILDYLSTRIDILILGKILGATDLGIYNLAKELVSKLYSLINGIVNKVILPYFAKWQNDINRVQDNYSKLLRILSAINYFGYLIMCIAAKPLTLIIYGEEYLAVAPILAILSIWGMLTCVGNPVGNIVVAFGRTDLSFKYTLVRIAIYVPIIYYLSRVGLTAISIGQIFLGFISLELTWLMILRPVIKIKWQVWSKSYLGLFIVTLALCYTGYSINDYLLSISYQYFSPFIIGVTNIFGILYICSTWLIYRKEVNRIFSIIKEHR